jgi:riboflavin kinase
MSDSLPSAVDDQEPRIVAAAIDEAQWQSLYEGYERVFDEPIYLQADVVHGFKRGSKELGIPTANLNMDRVEGKGESLSTGIYFGWTLLQGVAYESVVSVGWNPFYKNEKKTIEAHLLHTLDDFYGAEITTVLCGYLRNEANFKSLDELISCIHLDIKKSRSHLVGLQSSSYFPVTSDADG